MINWNVFKLYQSQGQLGIRLHHQVYVFLFVLDPTSTQGIEIVASTNQYNDCTHLSTDFQER